MAVSGSRPARISPVIEGRLITFTPTPPAAPGPMRHNVGTPESLRGQAWPTLASRSDGDDVDGEGAQGGQDPELAVSVVVEWRARIGIAAEEQVRHRGGGPVVGRKAGQPIVI